MKVVRFHEYGGTSVLRHEDAERPDLGPGQVLVRVAATSFNPVDAAMRAGYLQGAVPLRLPHVPGLDLAGTVTELGRGVTDLQVGQRVVGLLPLELDGAAADYVVVPVDLLATVPGSIDLPRAAALPIALTAWQALFEHADVQAGQRVLVLGAGGTVGGYAVQLARRAGAHVIASASPRSAAAVRGYGADEVLDRTADTLGTSVTGRVDAVLNFAPLGPADAGAALDVLRPGGVLVTTVPPPPDPQGRDVRVLAMFVRGDAVQLAELVALVDAGELAVADGASVPLNELAAVHERSDAGQLHGKVVLTPAG